MNNLNPNAVAEATSPTRTSEWRCSLTYFHVYACCLLTLAVPSDKLHYLLPVVYVAVTFFTNRGHIIIRLAAIVGIVLGVSALSLLIDSLRGYDVSLAGVLWALPCYSFLFIALAERPDVRVTDDEYHKIVTLTAWFVIVQSSIGYVQFLLSRGESDSLAGTFGIFDYQQGAFTFGQVFYSLCISCMVLFLMLEHRRTLVAVAIVMGLIAFALAQATHQIGLYIVAIGVVVAIQRRSIRAILLSSTLTIGMLIVVLFVYPDTIEYGVGWYRKTFHATKSPKVMVVESSAEFAEDLKTAVLGTGIGQFAGRGALIATGEYLSVKIPKPFIGTSEYYERAVQPAVLVFNEVGEGSAVSKPYFSLLTIPIEFGLCQTILILSVVFLHLRMNYSLSSNVDKYTASVGSLANIGIVYLVLLCLVENYAEFSQALLVPLALYLIAVSRGLQRKEVSG